MINSRKEVIMDECLACRTGCITRRKFMEQFGKISLGSVILTAGISSIGCSDSSDGCMQMGDEKELHKSEIIQFQKWCQPVISQLLGSDNYDRFCQAALSEYDRFASQLPCFEDEMNRSLFYANCPWMLSNYRALLGEFSLDQKQALEMLRKISNFKHTKKFENQSFIMKFIYPRIAKYDFLRDATLKKFMIKKDEKYGWGSVFPKSDAYIAVDYTKCGLTDWFRDQGVPEIAPIACEGDYIQFALWKGLKFERTMTIANGDKICDMRFVKV